MKKYLITILVSLATAFLILKLANAETFEKVDDSTVKITSALEKTVTISDLKADLKIWKDQLQAENLRHDEELIRLQAGIDERKAKIREAKKVGVIDNE